MPRPSSCRSGSTTSAIAYSTPPPTSMPSSDAIQPGSVNRLKAKPTTMPGRVIDVRQQLMLEIDREQHDQRAAEQQARREQRSRPVVPPASANIAAVSASTIG